ncbi:MAG: ABC transporter permease [Thermodesulfovibrionales bacterium]
MQEKITLFKFAKKNLRRKPLMTFVLIISISLLVSIFIFSLSFVINVTSSIKKTSERLGADILIVPAGTRGAAEDVLLENRAKPFYMKREIIERVKQIKGIDTVTAQTYLVTLTGLCCDVPETLVVAFDQDTDFIVSPWLKERLKRHLKKGEAIAGQESFLNINLGLMEIDSTLFGNTFRIVGSLDKTGTGLDNAIFISDENMEDIIKNGKVDIKPGHISILFVKVKKGYDPYNVARNIEDNIVEVDTMARRDIGKNLVNSLRDINSIFILSLLVSSLLSVFLTWAIFSAIVNERRREVGIMRAMGAKTVHVTGLFLIEVLIIAAIGSSVGAISGTLLSLSLSKSFHLLRTLSTELTLFQRLIIAILSFLAGTTISAVGALSPIWKVRGIDLLSITKE